MWWMRIAIMSWIHLSVFFVGVWMWAQIGIVWVLTWVLLYLIFLGHRYLGLPIDGFPFFKDD